MPLKIRYQDIPNGDHLDRVYWHQCQLCRKELFEGHPHFHFGGEAYCNYCALLLEIATETEFLKSEYRSTYSPPRACVRDGKVVIWWGRTPPWEATDQQVRRSGAYRVWRAAVLARDSYTCQECQAAGSQAHNIKRFKTHPKQRFKVSNGVTLCFPCHQIAHKKTRETSRL